MSDINDQYGDTSTRSQDNSLIVDYGIPKKLHPLTLLYNSFSFLPQIGIPAFLVLTGNGGSDSVFVFMAVAAGILVLPSMYLSYVNFSYIFMETDFVVISGVFSKRQRTVPYRRIQNVAMKQNVLMRMFDLVSVTLETAGDAGKEAELRYVKSEEYERIKSIVGWKSKTAITNDTGIQQNSTQQYRETIPTKKVDNVDFSSADPEVIYKMTISEIIKYGAMRIRPTILAILAWIWGFSYQFVGENFWSDMVEEIDVGSLESAYQTTDWLTLVLYIMIVFVTTFLLSWIIDILLGVNMLWGFTLTKSENKLFSERGLLNRVKKTIPLKKLQMAQYTTNPIKRFFGYYGIDLHTAGSPASGQPRTETKAIPLATKKRLKGFVDEIIGEVDIENLQSVSRLTIRRAVIRYSFFILFIAILIYFVFDIWWPGVALVPLSVLAAYIRWKYRGYDIRDNKILVKEGYFVEKLSIIPLNKIQNLHVYSSFFQRRLGLATLYVDTAAFTGFRDAAIIDISYEEAEKLQQEITAAFRKSSTKGTTLEKPEGGKLKVALE